MTEQPAPVALEISEEDCDSLHILPLAILPIQTPALKRARLIKNIRLETMVEIFKSSESGSGQLGVEDLAHEFGWPTNDPHPDLILLRKLALMPSYDVYSLRVLLRQNGIPVNDIAALKLSPAKNRELTEYMARFTRPLILQIYGDEDLSIQSFEDVIGLFRDPDIRKARQKLEVMAGKLGIKLEEVPRFLEDYGDIFLSLSYYRKCLDDITPSIDQFLDSLDEIRKNWQLKADPGLMKTCTQVQATFNNLMANISGRFENFDRSTEKMWDNITGAKFRKVQQLIESYHTTIGGVLCSLTVKMDAWTALFPKPEIGGPVKRAEFVMTEMKQGIERILRIEDAAPMLAELDNDEAP
ncbi:MAG: hypothetical protein H7841_01920 [Magnetospirillum sp. WYHS-4]